MGGNAFGRPAQRLSTAQLEALEAHCKTRLAPYFKFIKALIPPRDKHDHGDLDVLCSWDDPAGTKGVKGGEGGKIHPDGQREVIVTRSAKKATKIEVVEDEGQEGSTDRPAEVSKLSFDVTEALGGVQFLRGGRGGGLCILSVAVPGNQVPGVGVIEPTEVEPRPFFQVDLNLILPDRLEFSLLTASYGTTLVILSTIVKIMAPALTLHLSHLGVKYTPYPGLATIKIPLTTDPTQLCEWFGLDYEVWKATRFETEIELWKWLIAVPEGTILHDGYNRIVDGQASSPDDAPKNHRKKVGGWEAFKIWLQTSPESKFSRAPIMAKTEKTVDSDAANTETPAIALIDPENPAYLNSRAKEAIDKWGARDSFDKSMKESKEAAIKMVEAHMRNAKGNSAIAKLTRDLQAVQVD